MAGRNQLLTLSDVVSMLEDENDFQTADIFMEPPSEGEETDEDSGEEEGCAIENLPGWQLRATASATIVRPEGRERMGGLLDGSSNSDSSDGNNEEPACKRQCLGATGLNPTWTKRDWKKTDIPNSDKFTWKPQALDLSALPQTPTGLFELLLDDDIVTEIIENSVKYAELKGRSTFQITSEEFRAFLAILLISGYSRVPRRRLYWSNDADVRNDGITGAMTRDRFDEIMRYLHFSDNTQLDRGDKMAKVRPLLTHLNEKFLLYFPREQQCLSLEESMIPYFGRHGVRQSIKGKPIRFGYKIWALTSSQGYGLHIELHQEKKGQQATDRSWLGMGAPVMTNLLAEMQKENSYHVTFDNPFTSFQLVDELTKQGIACTGTIRANRMEDCPLVSTELIQNSLRGTYDYAYDSNNELIAVRWYDNHAVNIVSNKFGIQPVQPAKRWSRAASQPVTINQPHMIRMYNQTMGGVNKMDQNISKYRIGITSKKWWWPIFAYMVDLCVQQVWHLYRASPAGRENPLDLLGVRRSIVSVYLARGRRPVTPGIPRGRPARLTHRVADEVRYDRKDHLICTNPTQRRCVACGKKTKRACRKCNVAIHDRCFELFHLKLSV